MSFPVKPILRETKYSYELYIHPADKERAKAIEGRKWDWNKKCWVYPHSTHFYNAIMAEFGDEIIDKTTEPVKQEQIPPAGIRQLAKWDQTEELQKELQQIKETLTAIAEEDEESDSLKAILASKDQEISTIKQKNEKLNKELVHTRKWLGEKASELERVSSLVDKEKADQDLDQSLFSLANEATGGDQKFSQLLSDLDQTDVQLVITIANQMASELRELLNISDSEDDLYTLINMAKEADLLSNEALHLAHLIRVHRNISVHGKAYGKTEKARFPLILFAAALLWPEFPE